MGKSYDHVYHFKGGDTIAGTMICCVCNKPIDNKTQDWKEARKDKGDTWSYVCHHRNCYPSQDGWVNHELVIARKKEQFERAKSIVLKCIEEVGGEIIFTNVIDDLGYLNYLEWDS